MTILWFPCALCSAHCKARHGICDSCQRALPMLSAKRCRCGLPVPDHKAQMSFSLCMTCEHRQPAFDQIYAPYAWAFPLDQLLSGYKYRHRLYLEPVIHQLWTFGLDQLQPPMPDGLVPVPSPWARLLQRGFNQSARLARLLGHHHQITVMPCLRRTRRARRQQQLPAGARQANISNTLVCHRDISGMHLAVIDDVVTTAATANEAARALRLAGASRVDVWALARALPGGHRTHFSQLHDPRPTTDNGYRLYSPTHSESGIMTGTGWRRP